MSNQEIKSIERVLEKPIIEVEKTEIPAYLRNREKVLEQEKINSWFLSSEKEMEFAF